jgi:aminoglycoside phosphotransferase (APT) family kinase protein
LLEQYGLRVPKPILINGHEVFKVLGFWAEAESYLPHLPAQVGQYPQIFAALGELHQAMLRCWVSTIPEPRFPNYGTIVQLKTWLQGSVERMEITANERETIQRVSYAIQTLSNLEQRYLPSLPHVPVHGDYTHSNIGFTADGEPVYLDFDVASLKPRVHDLAYAAVIMLRRMQYPLDPQATSWDLVWDMVDIYEQSVPVPLTSLERWAFPIEMVRVNLCSAARAAFPSLHESSWLVLMHGLAEAECILRSSM